MDPKILYIIIGVVITAIFGGLVKLIPVIAKAVRTNNPGSGTKFDTVRSLECKPGKADICIKRGTMLTQHTETLKYLVKETEESKEDRKEIKSDVKKILLKVGG